MATRQWMIDRRERARLSREAMAKLCQCSERLLEGVEEFGWVTHPHIASRIIYIYGGTLEQFNEIVPECRRTDTLPEPVAPPRDLLSLEEILRGYTSL